MALLLWGLTWFLMSVFIFTVGRVVPSFRSKPPPPVERPRRPRNPRIRSLPTSPVTAPIELVCLEADDVVSTKSAPTDLHHAAPPPSSSKRPPFKPRWSFANARKSSRSSSAKSSAGSTASLTLVDNNSPARYVPDLSAIESECGVDIRPDQDTTPRSAGTSLSDSPRSARNVRLPSMKILKTFSRKMSSKQRSATVPGPSASPTLPIAPLDDEFCEPTKQARRSQSRERPEASNSTLASSERRRPPQRANTISGEVFTTTFVNPFRTKPRKPKASLGTLSTPPLPAPRRASGPRRMLNSLHLTLATNSSHPPPVPDSPRSSISSASTSTFSASSIMSAFSGSSGSPRSVRRTRPYAAPYYAAMPGTAGSAAAAAGAGASGSNSAKSRPDSSSKAARRRAASYSLERQPEPVEEESEDANALGLEFGQMESRLPQREVQTGPHRRHAGHRLAASEGVVLLGNSTTGR